MAENHELDTKLQDAARRFIANNGDATISWLISLAQAAVENGDVDPEGKTDYEVMLEAGHFYLSDVAILDEMQVRISHEERLLEEARRYRAQDDHSLAILLYATWLEHRVNYCLIWAAEAGGLTRAKTTSIIRHCYLKDKVGVQWTRLYGVELSEELKLDLLHVAGERNEFVHYKWTPKGMDADVRGGADAQKRGLRQTTDAAERAVLGLNEFYASVILKGFTGLSF